MRRSEREDAVGLDVAAVADVREEEERRLRRLAEGRDFDYRAEEMLRAALEGSTFGRVRCLLDGARRFPLTFCSQVVSVC